MADTAELEREEVASPVGSGAAGGEASGISPSWLPGALAPAVSAKAAPVVEEPSPTLDWMTTLSPETAARRQQLQQAKVDSTGSINRLFGARAEEDRVRRLKAYDATNIQPGELQPWDAEAAREKYKFDPLESFGSLGSAFAMIASAFTRAPMTNALNAGAAAMNAIKDGKDQDYERAFKAFKENTDLALKRHQIMQQRYADADKFASTDLTTWRSMITATAAEYDDQQVLTLMQAGLDKPALDAMHSRNTLARDMQALSETDMDHQMKRGVYKQMAASIDEEFSDPMQRSARKLAAMRFVFDKKEPKPEDAAFGQWFLTEGYKAPPDAAIAKAAELKKRYGHSTVDEIQAETAKAIEAEYLAEGKVSPAEAKRRGLEESTRAASKNAAGRLVAGGDRTASANETIAEDEAVFGPLSSAEQVLYKQVFESKGANAALRTAQFNAARERLKALQAELPEGGKLTSSQRLAVLDKFQMAVPTASPMQIDIGARNFIEGNPEWNKGAGRDPHSVANAQAVKERASEILINEKKLSPEDAARLITQNQKIYAGDKNLARLLFGRMAGVMSPAIEALAVSNRVLEWSDKVPRSRFPNLNAALNAGRQAGGATDVVQFRIATEALLSQYARAIAGGQGITTEGAQKRAHQQLEIAYSKGQMKAAVAQIRTEMFDLLQGTKDTVTFWKTGVVPTHSPDFHEIEPGLEMREVR